MNRQISLPDEHPKLTSYKALLSYLQILGSEVTTAEELDYHYENSFVNISIDSYSISVPFDAVIYNSLVSLVETLIKEF